MATFGTVASAETTRTGAYEHNFSINNSNQNQSLTISIIDWDNWDYQYWLAMIESFWISWETGGFITLNTDFKSKKGETASLTSSYTEDKLLLAKDVTIKLADDLTWLSGATWICVKNFELTINKNLEEDYCLWSVEPSDFFNKQVVVEWTIWVVFKDNVLRDYALNNASKAMRISIIDTNTTIWISDNPT